jgi:hypothetical protein
MARPTRTTTKKGAGELTETEVETLQQYLEVIDGNLVRVTRRLDGDLYERIKLILERLGGVYMTGRQRFAFDLDPSPLLARAIALKQMPAANPLDFFYSTQPVVEAMMRELEWGNTMLDLVYEYEHDGRQIRAIEPNAGLGHLADAFRQRYPMAAIEVCELDPYRRAVLEARGYRVVAEDFLRYRPPADMRYDVVLMNPPFTIDGDPFTFTRHITHAEALLFDRPGSKLVSVVPAQFARVERYHTFHVHVLQYGDYEDLPQASFVEAGTKWETALISLSKRKNLFYATWDEPDPEDGFPNKRLQLTWMYISVDATLSGACERLIRDMVEGRLLVYASGEIAPKTRERIREFCQLAAHHLLYNYKAYILFTPADLEAMERHILSDYRLAREHYSEMKRAEWERAQQRKRGDLLGMIEQAQRSIESYSRVLASQRALLASRRSALGAFDAQGGQVPDFHPAEEPPAPGEQVEPVGRAEEDCTGGQPTGACQSAGRSEKPPRHTQLAFF